MHPSNTSCARKRNGLAPTFYFRFLTCFFIVGLAASSAFGQSQWSDTWLVGSSDVNYYESEPLPNPIPGAYFKGCGVTEDNYNSYGHDYWVDSTLTSPFGRTGYGSGGGSAYARTDVSLPLNSDEEGDFTLESVHHTYCPIIGMELGDSYTVDAGGVGLRLSAYQNVGISNGRCLWSRTCFGTCSSDHTTNTFGGQCFTQGRIYKQCMDVTYYGGCFIYRVACAGRVMQGLCT